MSALPSHPRFLIYLKKKEGMSEPSELLFLADAFVKSVTIGEWNKVGDHFEYELKICSRTRFLLGLKRPQYVMHKKYARYSGLLALHKEAREEIATYSGSHSRKLEMPTFPSKKWFGGESIAIKRVQQLNVYFTELFQRFETNAMFSQTLLKYFAPQRIDLTIFGCSISCAQAYLNCLTYLLSKQIVKENTTVEGSKGLQPCLMEPANHLEIDLSNLEEPHSWKKFIPFDYFLKDTLYRIDIQNLYDVEQKSREIELPRDGSLLFLFDLETELSVDKFGHFINFAIKLREERKDVSINFSVVGITCPERERLLTNKDIRKILENFGGTKSSSRYTEVNVCTGEGIINSLNTLLCIHY